MEYKQKGLWMPSAYDGNLLRFKEDYVVGLKPVMSGNHAEHRIKLTSPSDVFLVIGIEVFDRHALFFVMIDGEMVSIASPFNIFDARNKMSTKTDRLNSWLLTIAEEVG